VFIHFFSSSLDVPDRSHNPDIFISFSQTDDNKFAHIPCSVDVYKLFRFSFWYCCEPDGVDNIFPAIARVDLCIVLPGQKQLDNTRTFSGISGKTTIITRSCQSTMPNEEVDSKDAGKKIILKPQSNSIGETLTVAPTM
jgi:hypothetical protein